MSVDCLTTCPLVEQCRGQIRDYQKSTEEILELGLETLDAIEGVPTVDLPYDDLATELRAMPPGELTDEAQAVVDYNDASKGANAIGQGASNLFRVVAEQSAIFRSLAIPYNEERIGEIKTKITDLAEKCPGPTTEKRFKIFGERVVKCSQREKRQFDWPTRALGFVFKHTVDRVIK